MTELERDYIVPFAVATGLTIADITERGDEIVGTALFRGFLLSKVRAESKRNAVALIRGII